MNKEQFLNELARQLNRLSYEEREDVLQDFTEHFSIGLEKGETEQQISASLGSPQLIAQDILANYSKGDKETIANERQPDLARTIIISILLVMFNLTIMLGPFMAVVGTVLSGWITGFVFIMTPFLYLFKMIILPNEAYLFEFFLSIGLTGLGILLGIAMYYITRFIIQLTIRYVRFNVRVAKGEN